MRAARVSDAVVESAEVAARRVGVHTAKKVGKINGKQIAYVKHAANRCLLFEVIGYQCSGRRFVANQPTNNLISEARHCGV